MLLYNHQATDCYKEIKLLMKEQLAGINQSINNQLIRKISNF